MADQPDGKAPTTVAESAPAEGTNNKGGDCCGTCGNRASNCKTSMDNKIKGISFGKFRLGIRACNIFMAISVIFCVILGYATNGVDSYATFVLSVFLLLGGLALAALELTCCCAGVEGKMRRLFPFVHYARGRAWLIVLFAFLGFGMGVVPILVGVFCLLPYGLFSRYMIRIHPAVGDRLVTTITSEQIADIEAKGLCIYDHYAILDVKVEAEYMSTDGIVMLREELVNIKGKEDVAVMQQNDAAVAGPSHENPPASLADNPFNDAVIQASKDPAVQAAAIKAAQDPAVQAAAISAATNPAVTNAFAKPGQDRV